MQQKIILALIAISIVFLGAPALRSQQADQPPDRRHFDADDRKSMHDWYALHHDELPTGLQKKDRLPDDLEKQLLAHETLSEALRTRIHPAPPDFLIHVPPAPENCQYVFIGGHAVLLDPKTNYVYDVFHFEKKLK